MRALWETQAGRAVVIVLGVLALLTAIGLAVLWPRGEAFAVQELVAGEDLSATVTAVIEGDCEELAGPGCERLAVELNSGAEAGSTKSITLPGDEVQPDVEVGDDLRVLAIDPASDLGLESDGAPLGGERTYIFVDFERGLPLAALAMIFVVLVVVLGRRRGALALCGLAASLALVLLFVVPAIVQGGPPLGVALVGASAVMLITISLTHGLGAKSAAAMLGTTCALLLTALLATLFIELGAITGLVSEQATLLRGASEGALSLPGLVLAGVVIGALGVLDDVTVSQSSTVMALRRADPSQGARQLYSAALDVGRDHVGATVNTLVLAYVGAALPVLLLFSTQDIGLGTAVQREAVAEEIVATLVGSIGLITAMPLTTALAAALAVRLPVAVLGHGHEHAHPH
ncbi:MAG: YibE/F family protein [Solirubrobacteraceae bacterium MAG38_C4-C5]|nr:YibE/F family protein [Candidatus Siliceabacter maunaloa]